MNIKDWLNNYGKKTLDVSIAERLNHEDEHIKKLKEEKDILELAIDALSPEDARLIIGRYIEKKSYEKLAREMGYAKSTVFARDKKAVKKLEELIE